MSNQSSAFGIALRNVIALCVVCGLGVVFTQPAHGQSAFFFEDFEDIGFVPIGEWGPAGLIDDGWIFANNSQPLGPTGWFAGEQQGGFLIPLSGATYLAASANSSAGGSPQYSTWAVLPAIPDQQAGDVLTFYTTSTDTSGTQSDSLQVRYSPTGGVSVGQNAGDVGDFTTVLLDVASLPNVNGGLYGDWTRWEITLPGSGRIAFRQYGNSAVYMGIEDVGVNAEVEICNADFCENFENLGGVCGEGPCALVNDDWIFRDQSVPATNPAWEPRGPNDPLEPHEGFGHMKSVSAAGGTNLGGVNNWAIMPDVFQPGDVLTFFMTASFGGSEDAAFEVRYSPTGATGTGSGLAGVGDFTDVLLHLEEVSYGPWQPVTLQIPGSGRVAIRFTVPFIPAFSGSRVAAVDTLQINGEPIGPPLPEPGETVTWDASMNPIVINSNTLIPAGATLFVEPGVVIDLTSGSDLIVAGEMYATGTAESPILMTGPSFGSTVFAITGDGHAEFSYVDLADGRYFPTYADHCSMTNGQLNALRVTNCTYQNAGIGLVDRNLAVRDSTFTNGGISLLRGYMLLENVSIEGSGVFLTREECPQVQYFGDLTITNFSDGPAIQIGGYGSFVDANNLLTGNLYPVELRGGLVRGSSVPPSGNINNMVHVQNNSGPTNFDEWAPVGAPYFLEDAYFPGLGLEVLPGVEVLGQGFGRLWAAGAGAMRLMGLPDNPIVMEGAGGAGWDGVRWSAIHGHKAEYVEVRDGTWGMLVADSAIVTIDSCILENNDDGIRCGNSGFATIRKSQILDNNVGVSGTGAGGFDIPGEQNPNSIAGNNVGVNDDDSTEARFNWWADPSGPAHPSNPGGSGDSANAPIDVLPFRTTPPDFGDHPPVVRMEQIDHRLETNQKLVLYWTAFDDSSIVSQRILFGETNQLINPIVVMDNLPGHQRSAVVTVPELDFFSQGAFFVEATDDAAQIGMDLRYVGIADDPDSLPENFEFNTEFARQYVTGEEAELDEPLGFTYSVELDARNESISLGAGVLGLDIPFVSTDTARVAAVAGGAGKKYFSEYFSIRPPEYIGDEAAEVTLITPVSGSFAGGSIVPVSWTATDDEQVRSIDIQATYDGGRSWHWITHNLPGDQTSYSWRLPPIDEALTEVQLRVVAWDKRFQSSSATSDTLTLAEGDGAPPGDVDGDGDVDFDDFSQLLASWGDPGCGGASPCPADIDNDGDVDFDDFTTLLANWS